MTDSAATIQLTGDDLVAFETNPAFQVAQLRSLRRAALLSRRAAVLATGDGETLAASSPTGNLQIFGATVQERDDATLPIFRDGGSTFIAVDETVVQLQRDSEVCLMFVPSIPASAVRVNDADLTDTLLVLAEAAESLLEAGWPPGYYRAGDAILWSSGSGRVYRWDGNSRALRRLSSPPATATRLDNTAAADLPVAFKTAVEGLVNVQSYRRGSN